MSRGIARERAVKALLTADGWWCIRAAASLGDADIVAIRQETIELEPGVAAYTIRVPRVLFIEVKSTTDGPYKTFGPGDRAELRAAAESVGAEPWLAWWPPRRPLVWIPASEWPRVRAVTPNVGKDAA